MADDKIIIQIDADESALSKSFKNIENQAKATAKNLGQSFEEKSIFSGLLKGATSVAAGIGLYELLTGSIRKLNDAFQTGIKEATEQESALKKLNFALAQSGQFSNDVSKSLTDYADSLAKTSKFSDDAIISTQTLLLNIGRISKETLPEATQATLDLASAIGIDLETATRLVAKSAQGNIEAFKRYGLEIQKGKTDAESFSNVLQTLNSRFGGAARNELNTFSGATTQLQKSFKDILEELGNIIVKSPTAISFIKELSNVFFSISKVLAQTFKGDLFNAYFDNIVSAINITIQFGKVVELIINALTGALGALVTFASLIGTILQSVVTSAVAFGNALGVISETSKISSFSALSDQIKRLGDNANFTKEALFGGANVSEALGNKTLELIEKIRMGADAQTTYKNSVDQTNVSLTEQQQKLINQRDQLVESGTLLSQVYPIIGEQVNQVLQSIANTGSLTALQLELAKTKMQELQSTAQKVTQATTINLNQLGASIATNIGKKFGDNIAKGKSAFEGLEKVVLDVIGNMLIQVGEGLILIGIGMEALKASLATLSGAQAIAAGLALVVLGSVLKSLSGGSAVDGTAAGGGGGGISTTPEPNDLIEPEETRRRSEVTVNVLGNVLDRKETGLEITRILQETFDSDDTIFVRS